MLTDVLLFPFDYKVILFVSISLPTCSCQRNISLHSCQRRDLPHEYTAQKWQKTCFYCSQQWPEGQNLQMYQFENIRRKRSYYFHKYHIEYRNAPAACPSLAWLPKPEEQIPHLVPARTPVCSCTGLRRGPKEKTDKSVIGFSLLQQGVMQEATQQNPWVKSSFAILISINATCWQRRPERGVQVPTASATRTCFQFAGSETYQEWRGCPGWKRRMRRASLKHSPAKLHSDSRARLGWDTFTLGQHQPPQKEAQLLH